MEVCPEMETSIQPKAALGIKAPSGRTLDIGNSSLISHLSSLIPPPSSLNPQSSTLVCGGFSPVCLGKTLCALGLLCLVVRKVGVSLHQKSNQTEIKSN